MKELSVNTDEYHNLKIVRYNCKHRKPPEEFSSSRKLIPNKTDFLLHATSGDRGGNYLEALSTSFLKIMYTRIDIDVDFSSFTMQLRWLHRSPSFCSRPPRWGALPTFLVF